MMYRREFSRSNVRVWMLAAVVGTILIGCTNSTENNSSQKVETSDRDVRVENNQQVEVRGQNARTSSRSSVTTTTDGKVTRSESIERNNEITQKDRSSNKIQNGRYWVGATDQGLEVQGNRYRYDTEAGEQSWQNISNLKYVKDGVVFDGKNYWCLSTLASNPPTGCSADGWSR